MENTEFDFSTSELAAEAGLKAPLKEELFKLWRNPKMQPHERRDRMTELVVKEVLARGTLYYHAEIRDHRTLMYFDSETKRLHMLQSDLFGTWLAELTSINRNEGPYSNFMASLQDEALSRGVGVLPERFWAARNGAIYISCGEGQVAKITEDGWSYVDNGTDGVLFLATQTLKPWAKAPSADPFEACSIFRDMSSSDASKMLLKLWGMILPLNMDKKPPMAAIGKPGSGKTRVLEGLGQLWGVPCKSITISKDDKPQKYWTTINDGGLVILDNLDTKIPWISDALEAYSTGARDAMRKLYTDNTLIYNKANAWVGITSAKPDFVASPALADRTLIVRMGRRTGETKDDVLSREVEVARDAGLSWICDKLALMLADKGGIAQTIKRHPDFGAAAGRLGRVLGVGDAAIRSLTEAEEDKSKACLENDWLGAAILSCITEPWEGKASDLHKKLLAANAIEDRISAKSVGKHLQNISLHLEKIFSAKCRKDRKGFVEWSLSPRPSAEYAEFEGGVLGKTSEEGSSDTFAEMAVGNSAYSAKAGFEGESAEFAEFETPVLYKPHGKSGTWFYAQTAF